jgi:drug/metabolite transporter (DMT)-like permease
LVLTPVAILEGVTLNLSPTVWVALVVLALGCSGVAYWLWWYAAERMPISRASAFFFITPIVSTFLGAAVLGEPITAATLSGAVLVLGGVAVVQA